MAATHHLKVVRPTSEKCAVGLPVRKPNAAYRSREHLTEREVERLIEAAKDNRWGHRDATMVLLAFRHGLRASELVDLRWEQVDLENAILHVRRVKQGTPATHPLTGRELRALGRLQREQKTKPPFVFVSERGTPFSKRGFQAMVERAARAAGFDMKIHPHMLRHSCGIAAATNWRMMASIRVPSKAIWATSRSSTLSATPSWRRRALKAYFGISV
jgi:type 1 fimbriae regulatory protein FimB/type 1 fimbriae regulatory protein FimE